MVSAGDISLEPLTGANLDEARGIQRDDVGEEFVDSIDTLWELTEYGVEHGCIGRSFVIRYRGACAGALLLGEAIPWETDPPEMEGTPFYRLMGFVVDRRSRGMGLGSAALEMAVREVYREFGPRPIALGVHKDNLGAERFYLRHGFHKTPYMEGNDYYFLRSVQSKVPQGIII